MKYEPRDVYQDVTNRIVEQLEAGIAPWVQPWKAGRGGGVPHNAVTGRHYNGINVLLLMFSPYASQGWLTYKQAGDLGGNVKKGEHGTRIVFWKFLRKESKADPAKFDTIPMVRAYTVFNVEQCENLKLPERDFKPTLTEAERDAACEKFFDACSIRTNHGGNRAFYVPAGDYVQLPEFGQFKSASHYYATKGHEYTHATGHKSRLDRDLSGRFGGESYAAEELVAELGAAFLCAHLGIDGQLQHADYIGDWIRVLKSDKRAVFTASSKAQKACDWLLIAGGLKQAEPVVGDESEVVAEAA